MRARALRPVAALLPVLAAGAVAAAATLDLRLPGRAELTREVVEAADTYRLPVGPYAEGTLPRLEVEGRVVQRAYRLPAQGMTTLQILAPLRDQLEAAGYEILFDCSGEECGGFDFRFNTRVMSAPDIFVDLFDYRYLAASKGAEGDSPRYVSILVSRSGATGYVQIIHVRGNGVPGAPVPAPASEEPAARPPELAPPGDGDGGADEAPVVRQIEARGHAVLRDLDFGTGAATLGQGRHASLAALAAYLKADPVRRIALVGHTDAVGVLADNIALSRRRAQAVLDRLAKVHGVPRQQMEAEGVGYLAPVAPNRTAEGRAANRRVEAVLLNAE